MIETGQNISISKSAAARIAELLAAESARAFRVAVEGGGCSGFQYKFTVDHAPAGAHDVVLTEGNATVLIDDISLGFLQGSEIDYVESLAESSFQIKNPNSKANCGCGNSFSIM